MDDATRSAPPEGFTAGGQAPNPGAMANGRGRRQPDAPVRPLTCYLVEDSPVIRQNLIATLEEMLPLRMVGTADDERGALQWVHATHAECDLMLIDIVLKSGTGLEVLRRARAAGSHAKLVVLTNYASSEIRQRCLQLGADRVFDKSTELEELFNYCRELTAPRLQ